MIRFVLALVALCTAVVTLQAQSTFQLSGTISSVSGTTQFVVGRPFTITVTYNPATADTQPGATKIGTYTDAVTSYVFNYDEGAYVGTDASQVDYLGTTNFPAVDGQAFNPSGSGRIPSGEQQRLTPGVRRPTVSAIPKPATWAALVGVLALGNRHAA